MSPRFRLFSNSKARVRPEPSPGHLNKAKPRVSGRRKATGL